MTQSPSSATAGEVRNVRLKALLLDAYNPRLPPSQHGKSQEDLAVVLEMGFDAYTVAESMARHGYFVSEPLIVIRAESADRFVVIEGNRRLTALLGLTCEAVRREFATPERWDALAAACPFNAETSIPVVVAAT